MSRRTLPRFLFRGFTSMSGGGSDSRLNSPKGIIPHVFLDLDPHTKKPRLPTNIYDIQNLQGMIDDHLGNVATPTYFSSWAANFMTARSFIHHGVSRYLAILDTDRLESHVRVYHVPALRKATLTYHDYSEEYLIYGPVTGNGFHCVSWNMLKVTDTAGLIRNRALQGTERRSLKNQVCVAKKLASLFRPPHDTRPDIIIAVTVVMYCNFNDNSNVNSNAVLLDELEEQLSKELQALQLPAKGAGQVGLVNPYTYHEGFPSVYRLVQVLLALEDRERSRREKLLG
ncbi:hypothetical protein F4810DRAFT_502759 [Camillea tinctor]|nr:hypothetical protein F4810DRAFT_502759 [Camillea tinctor]